MAYDDPDSLTPDPRLDELTQIFAAGVRRVLSLRAELALPPDCSESSPISLDLSAQSRLHVLCG
jgi:hypothetical protein